MSNKATGGAAVTPAQDVQEPQRSGARTLSLLSVFEGRVQIKETRRPLSSTPPMSRVFPMMSP